MVCRNDKGGFIIKKKKELINIDNREKSRKTYVPERHHKHECRPARSL
jgi:hypothetical protein